MSVTVRELVNYFNYRQLTGNDESLDRIIRDNNTNRPGLELAGWLEAHVNKRVIIIGEKEHDYIQTMSEDAQRKVFDYLTSENVPMILISRDLPCPDILKEIAIKKNFPIFQSFAPTNSLIVEIVSFLEPFFATIESMHGVLLQVYGRGVLITGDSGVGKSEIALELIKKGHILVADDRVDIYRLHNVIKGRAPKVLENMLEIRGVGIIDVTSMFGAGSTTDSTTIDCIISLRKWNTDENYDRIGGEESDFREIFGIAIAEYTIPVSEGRSIATVIEAAVQNHILLQKGYNSAEAFKKKIKEEINKNMGER